MRYRSFNVFQRDPLQRILFSKNALRARLYEEPRGGLRRNVNSTRVLTNSGRDLLVLADRGSPNPDRSLKINISISPRVKGSPRDGGDFSGHLISTYFRRFPGIVLPEPRRRRVVRVFIYVYACMCGDAGVHRASPYVCVRARARARVCVCGCARISLFQAAESLRRLPPLAPLALALPSQPSTSPRLVSNDFPPSYPDSGTHPWGTASPLFRIPPPTSLHRRHPYSGKLVLLHVRREPGGRKENSTEG